ncbi:MAG TPA: hypothetical protein VLC46_11975 [Thermoanaerobaculia bacterium]|jgi:hypothetical protein|nr:hypothetical protein [Thermoanaerobaculia bacterium]
MSSSDPSKHLRLTTETFVTFVYAAAIHIIIHAGHERFFATTRRSATLLLLVVIFILSDWLSRTRLPWLIHNPLTAYGQLVKTFLELTCLYLLLFSALIFIDAFDISKGALSPGRPSGDHTSLFYIYIAIFLLATFAWNLHMFDVMKGANRRLWWHLFLATFTGKAIDLPAAQDYTKRYSLFEKNALAAAAPRNGQFPVIRLLNIPAVLGLRYIIPQSVALHLSLGNIVLAITLLLHANRNEPQPLVFYLNSTSITSACTWLVTWSAWPPVVFIGCLAFVWTCAALQQIRTNNFALWLLLFGGFVGVAAYYPETRFIAILLARLAAAAFLPYVFYLASAEAFYFGWDTPSAVRSFFRTVASGLLFISYLLLLAVCPPRFVPAVVVAQHLLINLFLQYAATPLSGNDSTAPLNIPVSI